jgi:hypothetical protein
MISFQDHLVIFLRSKRDCFGGLTTGCCDDKPWAGSPRGVGQNLTGQNNLARAPRRAARVLYYGVGCFTPGALVGPRELQSNQALTGNAPHEQRQGGNEPSHDGVGALVERQCHADIGGSRLPAAIAHAGIRDTDAAVEPRAGEL